MLIFLIIHQVERGTPSKVPAKKIPKDQVSKYPKEFEATKPLFSVEDMASLIIKDYPKLKYKADNTGKVSSWAVFTDDLRNHKDYHAEACHASMRYEKPGFDQLIAAAPYHSIGWRYYQWLSDSPFRAFSDKISFNFLQPGNVDTSYIHVTELGSWPANILYNFCIAARVPIEHKYILNRWTKFVDVGMDKGLAWLVSSKFGPNQINSEVVEPELKANDVDGLWSFTPPLNHNHNRHDWLDITADWNRVIHGDFDMSNVQDASYKDNPGLVTPCNTIWGLIRGAEFQPMMGKTMEELHKHFELDINKFDPNAPKPKIKTQIDKYKILLDEVILEQNNQALQQNVVNAVMAAAPGAHHPQPIQQPNQVLFVPGQIDPWPHGVNFAHNFGAAPAANPLGVENVPVVHFVQVAHPLEHIPFGGAVADQPDEQPDVEDDDFHFDDDFEEEDDV